MTILLTFCDTGETVTIVGDHDPALLKYFDCTRSGPRSAFDSNVVYQFEIMEYVSLLSLDFGEYRRDSVLGFLDAYSCDMFRIQFPMIICLSEFVMVPPSMLYVCEVAFLIWELVYLVAACHWSPLFFFFLWEELEVVLA